MIFPQVVDDIEAYLLYSYKDKEDKYAIGSICRDRFIEVGEKNKDAVMSAIKLMDGKHSFDNIDEIAKAELGTSIRSADLYSVLEKANLTLTPNKEQIIKNEFEVLGVKVFGINITKIFPFFSFCSKLLYPMLVVTIIVALVSLYLGIKNLSLIAPMSLLGFDGYYLRNILCIFFIMFLSISLHEIAHAITASKFGIIPRSLSLSLYLYVSPVVYIRLPGLYTIKPIQRIIVWSSGVMANTFLMCIGFSLSIIMQQNNTPEFFVGVMNYLWYVNLVFIVVNLCPLMPLDGYFLFTTIVKVPNLRRQTFLSVKNSIKSKKILIKPLHCVYFVVSITAMGYVFFSEILAMLNLFLSNLSDGIGFAFWSIKQYLFLIIVMLVARITQAKRMLGEKNEQK